MPPTPSGLGETPPLDGLAGAPFLDAFAALADALREGLVEVDEAGAARALNSTARELLLLTGSRDGGPAPPDLLRALEDARREGRPQVREVVSAAQPDAQRRSAGQRHVKAAVWVSQGPALVVLRDSTEERLLQERLLQSEKMASVGQLVSGVAHELNNPLTGVMGFAQLLLSRDIDETSRAQARTIYGEAERAAKIVQNLLSFARRRKPAKEMADVNALLAQVLELRSYDFTIRNISLDMELDPRMPRCWVDPDQVQQVFFNVVKNAEQAMLDANGAGRLRVRTEAVELRPGAEGVRISISDDGPGIPPEIQRRVFDPFFTTKEAGQGTGLGLTVSYGIIDEHGGRIWVESEPPAGATFVIEFPVGGPAAGAAPGAGPDEGASAPAPGEQAPAESAAAAYRVLVVDDEESIRLLLGDILEMDGHAVEVAKSGIEAWSRLDDGSFDVIITDMKMPGMDGATFYRELRQKDGSLARRVIFITGDTVSPDTRAFLQTVSNPVLSKPFKIGPLREAMESVTRAIGA